MLNRTSTKRSNVSVNTTQFYQRHSFANNRSYTQKFNTFRFYSTNKPPYSKQESFEKATANAFHPIYAKDGSLLRSVEEVKSESWNIYATTLNSTTMKPAITYTGIDVNFIDKLNEYSFFQQEDDKEGLLASGRIYVPAVHQWSLNATWVMAQAHKLRSFLALSDATYSVSAFTKELHCIFMSGYQVTSVTYLSDGHTLTHLTPSQMEQALNVTLPDLLHITPEQCLEAQRRFNCEKQVLLQKSKEISHPVFSRVVTTIHGMSKSQMGIGPDANYVPSHQAFFHCHFGLFAKAVNQSSSVKLNEDTLPEMDTKKTLQ